MKILFAIFLSGICCSLYSQEKAAISYLLVRIDTNYDNYTKKYYCTINAEGGCDSATIFYTLKKLKTKKDILNKEATFYKGEKDTANVYYNYFGTSTQVLNFISKNGWELLTIYTETSSGFNLVQNGSLSEMLPITTVSSRPVFCFKKVK